MDTDDGKLKESPASVAVPQKQEDEMSAVEQGKKVVSHDDSATTYSNATGTIDDDKDNGNDDEDNNLSSEAATATTTTTGPPPPPSEFKVFDKVIARDKDGLMYDAVIRRCLYGSREAQQIPIGLFTNAEAEAILKKRREQEQKLAAAAAAASQEEDGEQQAASEPPAWHYFVHYNKWNVNWDRWVSQDDVYEPTEKVQQYAARIIQEHKDLSNRLASSKPGKKKFQTIDGNTFLSQWRLRLERIDAEMEMYNPLISPFNTTAASIAATNKSNEGESNDDNKKSKKGKRGGDARAQSDTTSSGAIDRWSKATLTAEMKHRNEHNLTTMRQSSTVAAKKLVLPFALHKILVDQWEIISQCGMLPALPAPVTVRQVLDRYLASKQTQQQPAQEQPTAAADAAAVRVDDDTGKTTTIDDANDECSPTRNSTTCTIRNKDTSSPSPMAAKSPPSKEKNSEGSKLEGREPEGTAVTTASPSLNESQASLPKEDKETCTEAKQDEEANLEPKERQDGGGEKDDVKDSPVESSCSCSADIPQEFIEMAEGIASFFDQALPTRLLYRQELPQLRVLDAILPEEYQQKRLSEIYGGEHLLRLFIRLPEALVDGFAAKAAAAAAFAKSKNTKSDIDAVPLDPTPRIFALLSDFARFLHKHQSTLFCQSHRKWTAAELKEQQKMNAHQQRRKARAVQQQPVPAPAPPLPLLATNTSTSKHDVDEGKKEADSSKKSKPPASSSQGGRKRRKIS